MRDAGRMRNGPGKGGDERSRRTARPAPLRARSRRPGPSAGRAAQARDAPHGRPARDRTSHRAIRRSGIARRETVSDCGGYSARARRAGWDREATGAKAACTRPSDRRPRDRPLRRVRARPRNRKPRLGSRAGQNRNGTGQPNRKPGGARLSRIGCIPPPLCARIPFVLHVHFLPPPHSPSPSLPIPTSRPLFTLHSSPLTNC